jgi:uncharacterized Zn finger protein
MSWYGEFFPKAQPKRVAGGIKGQGKGGSSWWAKRWIAVLEGFDLSNRLQRGRTYARKGQVTAIDIAAGRVTAKVQGSAPRPYSVRIEVRTLSAADRDRLIAELNSQAVFAAKLLAGEMPADIERAFEKAGLSLFPKSLAEIDTDCSCPDWSNPCKHVAAVYYLIGEEFDRDPFLLFRLRGLDREALLAKLGTMRQEDEPRASLPREPLPTAPTEFWAKAPEEAFGEVQSPPVPAGLVRRLGKFPFWRGERSPATALEAAYIEAGRRGLAVFVGERKE